MSATSDWHASVAGGLAAALVNACGDNLADSVEWVSQGYSPSWGQVASLLDDLRAAHQFLADMIREHTPCTGCGNAAGIGCADECAAPPLADPMQACTGCGAIIGAGQSHVVGGWFDPCPLGESAPAGNDSCPVCNSADYGAALGWHGLAMRCAACGYDESDAPGGAA